MGVAEIATTEREGRAALRRDPPPGEIRGPAPLPDAAPLRGRRPEHHERRRLRRVAAPAARPHLHDGAELRRASAGVTRIFVADCEDYPPERRRPGGGRTLPTGRGQGFFAPAQRVRRLLADLGPPGYNAGDRCVYCRHFLRAFEVTDEDVELFAPRESCSVRARSSCSTRWVTSCPPTSSRPGAPRTSRRSRRSRDSHSPDVAATEIGPDRRRCRRTRRPGSVRRWTPRRDAPASPPSPRARRRSPAGAMSTAETAERLGELYWRRMQGRVVGTCSTRSGPWRRHRSSRRHRRDHGEGERAGVDVVYVGDSITVVPPLGRLAGWGNVGTELQRQRLCADDHQFAAAAPTPR